MYILTLEENYKEIVFEFEKLEDMVEFMETALTHSAVDIKVKISKVKDGE